MRIYSGLQLGTEGQKQPAGGDGPEEERRIFHRYGMEHRKHVGFGEPLVLDAGNVGKVDKFLCRGHDYSKKGFGRNIEGKVIFVN